MDKSIFKYICISILFLWSLLVYTPICYSFDPVEANKTLNKLSIDLSIKDVVASNLEDAADSLTKLKSEADTCIDEQKNEIDKLNNLLPKLDPNKEITLSPDQQFLIKKKTEAEKKLSECRLFSLQAQEAIVAFNNTAQKMKKAIIFSKKKPLIFELQNLPTYFDDWLKNANFGPDHYKVKNMNIFFILFFIFLAFSFSVWNASNRIVGKIHINSYFDEMAHTIVVVFKHYCVPLVTLGLLYLTAIIYDFYLNLETIASSLFAIGFLYYLALAIASFCFLPPFFAIPYCHISFQIAKPLMFRLKVFFTLCLVAALSHALFFNDTMNPLLFELINGIIYTVLALNLFFILLLVARAPKFLNTHLILRKVISTLLIIELITIIFNEWIGYQSFARYLVTSTSLSLFFIFIFWFIYNLFLSLVDSFYAHKYQWQRDLQHFLNIREDESLIEIYLFRLFAFLLFWSSILLSINEIWSISEEWTYQVNIGFFEGFTAADAKIMPFRIIMSIFFISAGSLFIRGLKRFLHIKVASTSKGAQEAHIMIMGYMAYVALIISSCIIAGVNLQGLAFIAGALSVGIGFGLKYVVDNFVSGLLLLLERPIKKGDFVIIDKKEGWVSHIGMRSTRINTLEKSDIIVPNSKLINSKVTNYMYNNKLWKIKIHVGVGYKSDIDLVKKLLLEVAHNHDEVVKEGHDEPHVYFMSFGDHALLFELWVVIQNVNNKFFITDDLNSSIDKIFKEHGIVIAYPQTDLHIKDATPFKIESQDTKKDTR
ncbi:MAG: mechanosensitive ion channel [Proteobacteria bacterium]|nr:mechanosensitive ion channel [Pseudomonadota bacterium]